MGDVKLTCERAAAELRRHSLLVSFVLSVLCLRAFLVAVKTILGLTNFRDVGYPDSATLLIVEEFYRSGHIYPAFDRPPYLVTLYGPLTYVILYIPYALAQVTGVSPEVAVRIAIVGALCVCVLFIFMISRQLYRSRLISWLCVLFAVSSTALVDLTTLIRPDCLALGASLMSIYVFIRGKGRLQMIGTAMCAGIAVLVKQTFLAAPVAITCWFIYNRRYKDAAFFTAGVLLTVAAGYAFVLWREPLLLKHVGAIRHPILEYRGAVDVILIALLQPAVLFAALGGLLVLWRHDDEKSPFVIYVIIAWFVALVTVTQVGGGMNYFLEPELASAVLAGPGLCKLQREVKRTPILVVAVLYVLLINSFVPILRQDVDYLKGSYREAIDYKAQKTRWESFVATVSGKRLLSTFPDVTIHSSLPEMPDPFLNRVLEIRGMWSSGPVVAQIEASVYDLIVVQKGDQGDQFNYRGIQWWSDEMWSAMKRTYRPVCEFDGMEVWLPLRGSAEIVPNLLAMGCLPVAT